MKKIFLSIPLAFAGSCAVYAQTAQIKSAVICAGAATLNNGSIIIIGQPFVGVMAAADGSVSVSSGVLPSLLASQGNGKPFVINAAITLQSGQFQFSFPTQLGHNYVVRASTNLVDWTPIWTNTGTWTGLVFQDTNTVKYPWRFYRVNSD